MRTSDIEKRVREAVVAARGDSAKAVSLLTQAVQRDPQLLLALTGPYLQGILFQAVQGQLKHLKAAGARRAAGPATDAGANKKPRELPREVMDKVIEELSQNIPAPPPAPRREPRTPAEALASLGRDPNGPPPPKAGKRHQTAMQVLAKSYKFKPRRGF